MYTYKKSSMISDYENVKLTFNSIENEILPHRHEFIELVYTISGTSVHYIDENKYTVSRGNLLFISYDQTHRIVPTKETTYIDILLTPEFLSNELINSENITALFTHSMFEEFSQNNQYSSQCIYFKGKELIDTENIINLMFKEYTEKKIGYKSILHGYMQILFTKILRNFNFLNESETNEFLPEIISYIDENIANKISLSDIAIKSFYNPAYFSKLLKEHFGKSFSAYVKEKRIEKAVQMLEETTKSIEEIMSLSGYSDKKLFYKHFKDIYNVSPGKYRKK